MSHYQLNYVAELLN